MHRPWRFPPAVAGLVTQYCAAVELIFNRSFEHVSQDRNIVAVPRSGGARRQVDQHCFDFAKVAMRKGALEEIGASHRHGRGLLLGRRV